MVSLCNIVESAFWQIEQLEDLHPPFPARIFSGPPLSYCIQNFSGTFFIENEVNCDGSNPFSTCLERSDSKAYRV